MANLRDIKRRIRSVSSTKQITHTMEMVSTTKIMRALTRAVEAAPYKNAMTSMLANVSAASTGENVPLLYDPEKIETYKWSVPRPSALQSLSAKASRQK